MPVTQDVRSAVEQGARQFSELYARGDVAAIARLYTNDAKVMPAGTDVVQGEQAMRQFWKGAMDMGIRAIELEVVEVEGFGDLAYDVGRYTLNGGDGAVIDRGKYLVVWKNDGGTWKIHRDMWTTNASQ